MTEPLATALEREAERIRSDGSLPDGFEARLRAQFEEISADPVALEAEARACEEGASPPTGTGRAVISSATARRVLVSLDRRTGHRLRGLERRAVAAATLLAERAAVGSYVAVDVGRRLMAGTAAERLVGRAVGSTADGVGPALLGGAGELLGEDGSTGDDELDLFLFGLIALAKGPILHTESGHGALVGRLSEMGLEAIGADPREGPRPSGSLEALAFRGRASLGGVVLSGVPDKVTPATARALTRLVASRLGPGGVFVVVSETPRSREGSDPVAADLAPGRPLHPVTWCHLAARFGLADAAVRESSTGGLYVVGSSRPR